jgi:peroxiredoxin
MNKILVYSILGLLLLGGSVAVGQQKVPTTALPDVVSGKEIGLQQYANQKAVVLVFTSNYCPFSRLYEERIGQLISQYGQQGVTFLLINPNSETEREEEGEAAMKEKAAEWGRNLPYLSDKQQAWARALGATKTPEVFVLTPQGGKLAVFYSGALDDNPQVAADVSQAYLAQALDQAVKGKAATLPKQRPVGCMIKRVN